MVWPCLPSNPPLRRCGKFCKESPTLRVGINFPRHRMWGLIDHTKGREPPAQTFVDTLEPNLGTLPILIIRCKMAHERCQSLHGAPLRSVTPAYRWDWRQGQHYVEGKTYPQHSFAIGERANAMAKAMTSAFSRRHSSLRRHQLFEQVLTQEWAAY